MDDQNLEILSNDECNCKYCSAVIIIPFGYPAKFYIPLSKKEFDEYFFSDINSLYNRFKQQRINKRNTVFVIE